MKTTFEVYYRKKPNLNNLKVFGCVAWQHIDKQIRQSKLDCRAIKIALFGFKSNGYLIMNPNTKIIYRSYYKELKNTENNVGDCVFDGDEFAYEAEDTLPNILDHNYATSLLLKKGEHLHIPESYKAAINSESRNHWI